MQILVWSVAIALYLISGSGIPLGTHIDTIIFSVASIWIYTVILLRMKQPQIFVNRTIPLKTVPVTSTKYGDNLLPESILDSLYENLLQNMEQNQLYLTPRLSLSELADQVGCSNHDLSQVINRKSSRNFHDFVNSYRLDHAKSLLLPAMVI